MLQTLKFHFSHWTRRWRELLKERKFQISLLVGIALLIFSGYVSFRAARYTDSIPMIAVGDVILDAIPTIDLSFIYTYGGYFMVLVMTFYPILFKPEIAPFTAKTVAAFVLVRAFFVGLTHIGAPADYFRLPGLEDQAGILKWLYLNDLFFSGHVGQPFLGALLFWENKFMRWFMLGISILQAFTVLFMHVHYSIDVFSAYFITYTIYILSDRIFNKLNLHFRKIVIKVEEEIGMK